MKGGTPQNKMSESNNLTGSQRRRSPRLSSPQTNARADKMALPSVAVKRSITVRKIAPRKTAAPTEHNKENTPRRSRSESSQQKTPKVSSLGPVPGRGGSSSAKKKKKEAAIPSPILPSSSPAPQQPLVDPEDAVWSQKVRRSYSRLSDKSFNSPNSRETLFGFEGLQTPEVTRRVERPKTGLEVSAGSICGLSSFTSLLEADECESAVPGPDLNIPGVSMVKEKRSRKKKVQQIGSMELEELAAQMNAEFEEAEDFELTVE